MGEIGWVDWTATFHKKRVVLVGAAVINGVMRTYVYGEISLKHTDWVKPYLAGINAFIEKHGGRVLSRSVNMEKIEGGRELPTNVILIEFPDKDAALGFFEDPDYLPLRRLRQNGSNCEFTLFPAEDLVGGM